MKIYQNITELIGHTPLLRLSNLEKEKGLEVTLLAKLEYFNPAGSAKDRVALNMIKDAENRGVLKKDSVIIEPTSGNTGIGLAAVAACCGYRCVLTMPETMSVERRKLLSAYGAQIILTDGNKGMQGAIEKAQEIAELTENSFLAGQFVNPANPQAHYLSTGPEIWEDTDGKVDIFVSGIGTGGTISGTGKYLKEKNPNIKIIGFEPAGSAVLSGESAGAHGLQGIGAGFIPKALNMEIYDEIFKVTDEQAYQMGRELACKEGVLVGITSGAAVYVAMELAKRDENRGKTIVALLPDLGDRYLSTPMFARV